MARIRKKIEKVARSPRVSSGIRVEGGGLINQDYLMSGDHYPDRSTLSPLILLPFCSYSDGTTGIKVDNAMPEVTDGCWYRLTPANRSLGLCEATKITASMTGTDSEGNQVTLFSIVSTPGASDYGRLTIRENIPAGEMYTYVFTGTLSTDGQRIEEYFNSRCRAISEVPDIMFDNNPASLYDPLHGERYFTINPKLTFDVPVVWKWMSYHELEGGWVDLLSTQLDWAVEKVGDGIKIDRKVMPDSIILKCVAEVTVDGVTISVERAVTHTRQMPSFRPEIVRVGAITEDVDAICPYALIRTGNEIVEDISELSVKWYSSSNAVVGEGLNPTIPLSKIPDGIYELEVKDRGGWALLVSDGLLVVSNGIPIRVRSRINN